jgi:hypothetical protein
MKDFWRNNGLSVTMLGLFGLFLTGQILTGYAVHNEELADHGQAAISLLSYLASGHFVEAVFENWESEFLQMGAYVVLTVWLFQKGSSESKEPGKFDAVDKAPKRGWRSSWWYRNSLAIALFALFVMSFVLHGMGGAAAACEESRQHDQPCESTIGYMTSSQFWFESFQNWQSEFLAVASLILLSIWLREEGSPESKPVDAPNDKTGSE